MEIMQRGWMVIGIDSTARYIISPFFSYVRKVENLRIRVMISILLFKSLLSEIVVRWSWRRHYIFWRVVVALNIGDADGAG